MLSSNLLERHRVMTGFFEDSVRIRVIGMGDDLAVVNSTNFLVSDAVLIFRIAKASFRTLIDLFILENMVAKCDDLLS